MKWLVVGAAGMLGQDVMARLLSDGHEASGLTHAELDVTDTTSCVDAVKDYDVVVNCAAWTAVDDAEASEGAAFAVNAVVAANLARAATHHGAVLVQISTDCVFDGDASQPYGDDAPLRTAWLYGQGGPNFAKTMARIAAERGTVSVVEDQRGQPTWSADVADLVVRLVDSGVAGGTFHATSQGEAS